MNIRSIHLAQITGFALAILASWGPLAFGHGRQAPPELRRRVERLVVGEGSAELRIELGHGCLAELKKTPDPELELEVWLGLGEAYSEQERFQEAWDHLGEGTRLARELDAHDSLAQGLWLRAVAAFNLGRLEDSIDVSIEGIQAADKVHWDGIRWRLASNLGLAYERLGDSEAALEALKKGQESAQRVAERDGNIRGLSVLLGNIGVVYLHLGELDQALGIFEDALEMSRDAGAPLVRSTALANLGDVLIRLDRLDEAYGYHQQALELRREQGSEAELALSYFSLGAIHQKRGEPEAALAEYEKSLEIRHRLGLRPETAPTLSMMAESFAALERDEEALAAALSSLDLADRLELRGRRGKILESLATVYSDLGDHAKAVEALREVLTLERERRSVEIQSRLAEFHAELETRQQQYQIEELSRKRELQELALKNQKFQRNALLVGALFVSGAAVAGWFAWASLRKALKKIRNLEQDRIRADKLDSIGLLAGGIAHDFNNILATVVGNLSVLRLEEPGSASTDEILQDIDQALGQGRELSTQLLSFAKGGVLARETQALEPLLRQATSLALSGSRSKASISIAPDLWWSSVDAGQLRQLVTNLVLNADQAMPEGGTITLRAENTAIESNGGGVLPVGDYVRITIGDEGAGIAPGIKDKIFDPYFTTKEEGTGLGLALAYAIVRRHHGSIDCRPNPAGGTVLEFLFPAVKTPGERLKPSTEKILKGTGRVLVMDDDPLICRLYSSSLGRLGYESLVTSDGRSALAEFEKGLAQASPFDAVILDLTIPGGMGGQETLRLLRQVDPDIRAIVASGYSADHVLENYEEAGFAAALPKPFTIAALSQAVEHAIGVPSGEELETHLISRTADQPRRVAPATPNRAESPS